VTARLFSSRPPRSILVVCTRRIGDVLLTTPLVRSLKARWPDTPIDMLVFRGTEGILEHNPDLRRVIVVAQRAPMGERIADIARIWRRYDLACAAVSSDRPRFYSWFAGKRRVGLVDDDRVTLLKRLLLDSIALNYHRAVHTVESSLEVARVLGIEPIAEVVPPGIGADPARRAAFDARFNAVQGLPLAVLHPAPMFAYKQWRVDGWVEVVRWLHAQGFAVALSGGPATAEREYAEQIVAASGEPVLNFVGQFSLGESAEMYRRARLYVGPDTSATHIAAATGTPTVALFGPSDTVRWGPWPKGWRPGSNPWPLVGSGRRGNVYLVQGEGPCVPCKQEGCDRHVASLSQCLVTLSAARVIGAIADILGAPCIPLQAVR
jgi:heptosyltransferase III